MMADRQNRDMTTYDIYFIRPCPLSCTPAIEESQRGWIVDSTDNARFWILKQPRRQIGTRTNIQS